MSKAEFIEGKNEYRGYKESEEVNELLTAIFGEEVFLMKAEKERVMMMDKSRTP